MPPRRPGWDRRQTTDACVAWAIRLVEPLVSTRRLVRLDAALAEATDADPELVALVFAGVSSDVVRTLPSDDAWRTVVLLPDGAPSGRAGDQSPRRDPTSGLQTAPEGAGAHPEGLRDPETLSGAHRPPQSEPADDPSAGSRRRLAPVPVWPSGAIFGTWHDGVDLVELAWGSPERDPAFVPLADDLAPGAGRVLVAALVGWRAAFDEALAVLEHGVSADAGATVTGRSRAGPLNAGSSHAGLSGHRQPHEAPGEMQDLPYLALTDALRWACWRRRAYGIAPAEDVWPYESAHHWASRGLALLEQGIPPDEAVIDADIAFHRIAEP